MLRPNETTDSEVFLRTYLSPFTSGTIANGEISTLNHKLGNNSVEVAVAKTKTTIPDAQLTKIF